MTKGGASYKDVLLGRPTKLFIIEDRTSIKALGRPRSSATNRMAILGHEDQESPENGKHE